VTPGDNPLVRGSVAVLSAADPGGPALLLGRQIVRESKTLQDLFLRVGEEGFDLPSALAEVLQEALGPEADAVALYLTDEYRQVGSSLLLISNETGRAFAKVTDADLYVPPAQAREGEGGIVFPASGLSSGAPRLKPQLEGAIVTRLFDQADDARALRSLAARLPGEPRHNDPRLRAATAAGRDGVVQLLSENLSEELRTTRRGSPGAFLRLLEATPGDASKGHPIVAMATTSIVDRLGKNLRHDPYRALLAALVSTLARSLADRLVSPIKSTSGLLDWQEVSPEGVWIVPPSEAFLLQRQGAEVLTVPSAVFVYHIPGPGIQVTYGTPEVRGGERSGRWQVGCSLPVFVEAPEGSIVAYALP
jgi:hypothetical protein